MESHLGRLQRVTSKSGGPHNRGKLCVKGWLGLDVVANPERLTTPLVRKNGTLVEVSWEEGLASAADGLRRAAARGPVMVGRRGPLEL